MACPMRNGRRNTRSNRHPARPGWSAAAAGAAARQRRGRYRARTERDAATDQAPGARRPVTSRPQPALTAEHPAIAPGQDDEVDRPAVAHVLGHASSAVEDTHARRTVPVYTRRPRRARETVARRSSLRKRD